MLLGEKTLNEVKQKVELGKFDLVPANRDLAGAEIELVNIEARETRLKAALNEVGELYDFVLLDCPPRMTRVKQPHTIIITTIAVVMYMMRIASSLDS